MTDEEHKADRPGAEEGGQDADPTPAPGGEGHEQSDSSVLSESRKGMVVMPYQPPPTAEIGDEPGGLPAPDPTAEGPSAPDSGDSAPAEGGSADATE
jgi:hypothetical protein